MDCDIQATAPHSLRNCAELFDELEALIYVGIPVRAGEGGGGQEATMAFNEMANDTNGDDIIGEIIGHIVN